MHGCFQTPSLPAGTSVLRMLLEDKVTVTGPVPVLGSYLKHHVKVFQLFSGEASVPRYGSDLEERDRLG